MATTFALHIDCDPLWIYARACGVKLDYEELIYRQALPQFIEIFRQYRVPATFFFVGRELERRDCQSFCASAVSGSHALANHTYNHPVDFSQKDIAAIRAEITECHQAIREHGGVDACGFRGPSYLNSPKITRILAELGYIYDSSSLPGPGALMMATFFRMRGQARGTSFGVWQNFFSSRRIKYAAGNGVTEVPIAVLPFVRLPIHTTFVYQFGIPYLDFALRVLSRTPGHHVLLFHAIDLIDYPDSESVNDKVIQLRWPHRTRCALVERILQKVGSRVVTTEGFLSARSQSM